VQKKRDLIPIQILHFLVNEMVEKVVDQIVAEIKAHFSIPEDVDLLQQTKPPLNMAAGSFIEQTDHLDRFTTTILFVSLCNKKTIPLNPILHDQIHSNLIQIQPLNVKFVGVLDTSQ
jgi:hypothetical protein